MHECAVLERFDDGGDVALADRRLFSELPDCVIPGRERRLANPQSSQGLDACCWSPGTPLRGAPE